MQTCVRCVMPKHQSWQSLLHPRAGRVPCNCTLCIWKSPSLEWLHIMCYKVDLLPFVLKMYASFRAIIVLSESVWLGAHDAQYWSMHAVHNFIIPFSGSYMLGAQGSMGLPSAEYCTSYIWDTGKVRYYKLIMSTQKHSLYKRFAINKFPGLGPRVPARASMDACRRPLTGASALQGRVHTNAVVYSNLIQFALFYKHKIWSNACYRTIYHLRNDWERESSIC